MATIENGDFSASELQKVMLKAQAQWMSAPTNHAEAIVAIQRNSSGINVQALQDPDKDNSVLVTWIDTCGIEVGDCDDSCEIDAEELKSNAKPYELNICFSTKFKINLDGFRKNTYNPEEVLVKAMRDYIVKMDEKWAQTALAKLHTFAGDNAFPQPFTYDAVNKWTIVPDSYFNSRDGGYFLPPFIQKQAKRNRMDDVYLIEDGSLYIEQINAQLMAGATDGASIASARRTGLIDTTTDLWNFAKSGVSENVFAIEKNAIVFATRARYSATPKVIAGDVLFSVPSLAIPNVRYDVTKQTRCEMVDGKKNYMDYYEIRTQGLIELKPESCPLQVGNVTYQNTGVMGYIAQAKTTTPEDPEVEG